MSPLSIKSFPQAILHIDGDCFFASCEMALNPKLKGKPVVTGLERGIASSMSYEAKALGVKRGMSLPEIKQICPEVIILPSDYETYSLFSQRMFNIVRRFTSTVEEYGIDECFAEITGLRRPLNMSYPAIAHKIKETLEAELGLTFSIGLGPTKVIAKVASKFNKPSGLTIIPGYDIHHYLAKLPVEKIWGIGPNTAAFLQQKNIKTALDFAYQKKEWVKQNLTKPFFEIWQELKGTAVYQLNTETKHDYQSVSKTKTFTPASTDKEYVFAQLSKNVENACIKIRRHGLAAQQIYFLLKTQGFKFTGAEIKLSQPTVNPAEILNYIRPQFEKLWQKKTLYRATGIVVSKLTDKKNGQLDLFGQSAKQEMMIMVYKNLDKLSAKFGKHAVFLGSSLPAIINQKINYRNIDSRRQNELFNGETKRKKIGVPLLGSVN